MLSCQVLTAEMSKGEEEERLGSGRREREREEGWVGGAEEDVWTAIKRTANRKCKSANAPAVVFGLAAVAVKSKQHEWLIQQLFKCRPSENSPFTLSEFSHCCIWLCLECVCALVFSSVELFTLRDRDESTLPCKWLCVCVYRTVLPRWLMAARY